MVHFMASTTSSWPRNHTDEAHVGQHYALWMEEKGLANWRDYYLQPTGHVSEQRRKWHIPEQFHYSAWIAERSKALISEYRSQDQPFFLWASFFDPHPKYLAPEPWDTMYDPADMTVPPVTPGEHESKGRVGSPRDRPAGHCPVSAAPAIDADTESRLLGLAGSQRQRLPRFSFTFA